MKRKEDEEPEGGRGGCSAGKKTCVTEFNWM